MWAGLRSPYFPAKVEKCSGWMWFFWAYVCIYACVMYMYVRMWLFQFIVSFFDECLYVCMRVCVIFQWFARPHSGISWGRMCVCVCVCHISVTAMHKCVMVSSSLWARIPLRCCILRMSARDQAICFAVVAPHAWETRGHSQNIQLFFCECNLIRRLPHVCWCAAWKAMRRYSGLPWRLLIMQEHCVKAKLPRKKPVIKSDQFFSKAKRKKRTYHYCHVASVCGGAGRGMGIWCCLGADFCVVGMARGTFRPGNHRVLQVHIVACKILEGIRR
jgi:hypothetical protein